MDAKDSFVFLVLLLLSLGLFGSLSLTFCLWNKHTEVASELQNERHTQNELKSELAGVHNELQELKNELKDRDNSEPSQDKLKRGVRQADEDTDTPSATEILTNALTEIIERKLVSYMNCDKNEYNHTKCSLKPGPKGEPGPEGRTGEKGTKGEPGDMGHRGEPGGKGMKGSPGYPGFKGEKGKEGVVGPQGPPGPTGRGGPRGVQGETGERGDVGQKGEPGAKGMKGNPGYPGFKGEKGEEGVVGPPGPTGPQGPHGIQGKDGQKGEQGPVGPQGDTGPRGRTGERGDKGDIGERGFKGDMGPSGPQGETGEKGDMGQKGEPGDKGMKGNRGFTGNKGEKGEQGVAGAPGPWDLPAPTITPTTTPTTAPTITPTTTPTTAPTTTPTTTPTATPGQCGGPGWRRVVFLNMTNPSHVCPTGLANTTYSRRTCGQLQVHSGHAGCSATTFSVGGYQYSWVCGRAQAYRYGLNTAFFIRHTIELGYVDGLSLTHGAPGSRQHIWTFASGGMTGNYTSQYYARWQCPCDNGNTYGPPSFVGNDYFCESVLARTHWQFILYSNAPLWDGQVCEGGGTCCKFNNPPWFTKNLANSTTDDIELRVCSAWGGCDVALELLELYVQ